MDTTRHPRRSTFTHAKTIVGAVCFLLLAGCALVQPPSDTAAATFEFGLIGDQQYDAESEAKFPRTMSDLDQSNLAFVVHVGDFRGGGTRGCDDALFEQRKEQFDASRHPFIYTPGDNDWTDCHAAKAGGYDPVERLAKLRDVFFAGNQSLGQRKLAVKRQSDSPQFSKFHENVRWSYGNILFLTLHLVGSNNNLGRTPEADAEYRERNAANLAWLAEGFEAAKRDGSRAVVIFTQANPAFEDRIPPRRVGSLRLRPSPKKPTGYTEFLSALESGVLAFGKPVVLMHGDTHYFRVDKPLFRSNEPGPENYGRQIESFTRVETFGYPEAHWVRIAVDARDPEVFTFKQQIVEKNRFVKP